MASTTVESKGRRAVKRERIVPLRIRVLGLLLLACVGVGCPCVKGPINSSPGIRWWLFSNFGASRMCPEMLKKGAPLKLTPGGNTIGRFFPTQCNHEVNDETQTVTIHFKGTGYAYITGAGRVGFSMNAAVEYSPDFYLGDDAMYVWARYRRSVYGPDFQIGSIENKLADWARRSPVGYLANNFGSQIVQSHLASGFTVVRTDSGDEFSLGILQPPQRPKRPFEADDEDRFVFANETTEIHHNQVDFLGPFEVADDDQQLILHWRLQGNAVDVLIMPKQYGDQWREAIQLGTPLGPPPTPPLRAWALQPGVHKPQKVKLRAGFYYVVVDNSDRMGTVNPPWNPLAAVGGNTVILSYKAELGEDD